jgi:predicted lipoprotein with Yx(FWY)xxD motif
VIRRGGWKGGLVAGTLVAVLLAACAKSGAAGSGGSAGGGGAGGEVATTSVQGIGSVLVGTNGLTLYHLSTETGGSIQCTGQCAGVWPPFLEASASLPAEGAGVTGTLGTVTRPDGKVQVTYDGMPLYTYSGDSKPGQANGQGIQGVWFAVAPSGSASPSSGGRGGYGGGGY